MVVTAVIVSRLVVNAKLDAWMVGTTVIVSGVVVDAEVDTWVVVTESVECYCMLHEHELKVLDHDDEQQY